MKKVVYIVLTLALTVALAACGNSDDGGVIVDPNASTGQSAQTSQGGAEISGSTSAAMDDSLYFEANGIKIHPYDLADDVLSALGEPSGTFESASCAYQGMDYFYYYDGFQLTVNDVEGTKRVTTITVVDDTVSIPQGVKIGSTEDEMLTLMGDEYTVSSGLYVFVEDDTTLQIQIKESKVAAILYVYTPQAA